MRAPATRARRLLLGVLFALLLQSGAAAEGPAVDPDLPPLYYTLTVKSETFDSGSLGLVAGAIGELYRRSHRGFLESLRAATADGGEPALLRRLACIGVTEPRQGCRRLIAREAGEADAKLRERLAAEPSRSALSISVDVIFDGRFFQVPTRLEQISLDAAGALRHAPSRGATYIRTYSRSQHQAGLAGQGSALPFEGGFGGKPARQHFWLAGEPARLQIELERAFDMVAAVHAEMMSGTATRLLAGDESVRASLPRLKDVVARDRAPCKVLHGDYRVVRELGDYVWLAFQKEMPRVPRQIFIEPRCGFDY